MPTVAVKPTRVASDWLDGEKFTRLMKTWRFHVCITVNRQECRDDVPFPAFDCNKTLELDTKMHQNALFWYEKIKNFLGKGI